MAAFGYVSVKSGGIDALGFYNDLGFTISEICRGTGMNKATVTKVPAMRAHSRSARDVLAYMEQISTERYIKEIKQIEEEIRCLGMKSRIARAKYDKCLQVANEWRAKYGLPLSTKQTEDTEKAVFMDEEA